MSLDWNSVTAFAASLPGPERVQAMIAGAREQALARRCPPPQKKT